MCGQALSICNQYDIILCSTQGILGIIRIAGTLCKACNAQRREEPSRSTGRKNVVRASIVVPQRFRCILSKEYRASVVQWTQQFHWIFHQHFQVFRCNPICQSRCFFPTVAEQNCPVGIHGFFDDFFSFQCLNLPIDFCLYLFCQLFTGGNQNGRCHDIVFRL